MSNYYDDDDYYDDYDNDDYAERSNTGGSTNAVKIYRKKLFSIFLLYLFYFLQEAFI